MKLLFICNQNKHRSRTAHELFKEFDTDSAGLYNNQVTKDQLLWADIVFVMEEFQRTELVSRYPALCMQKRLISLDIPDIYRYNSSELRQKLKSKVYGWLSTLQVAV